MSRKTNTLRTRRAVPFLPAPLRSLAALLSLAALSAIVIACAAGSAPAAAAPASSASSARRLPEVAFEKYELPNGLDVILHEDHSLPTVTVNVWYHVGSKNEKRGRTGFAHLFEHMMFQGSQHHDDDFFRPIEEAGGDVNGSTSEDRTNYWESVPSNYLEKVLWLEADRMGFLLPAMTQEKLDNQRDVVKNERRQGIDNQPYAKSEELILSMLYPSDHPYSWSTIGSMADLSAASLEDVSEFFRTYYTPNNASLVIGGDFDPRLARDLVTKYFAPIPAGPAVDRMEAWRPQLAGVKRAVAEDNVNLPRVYMCWPSPAHYARGDAEMDLLASALTEGKTSRLFKALVYEQQIAQDVDATQYSSELGSGFVIEVTAREGHTLEEVESAVDRELTLLLAKGVTEEELTTAKCGYEATFVRGIERVGGFGGRSDRLNAYNTYLGDPDKFEWDLARYMNATRADVLRTAKETIDLNRRAILHIVPQVEKIAAESNLDWSKKPAPAEEVAFTPPAIQRTTLSNGLDLLLVERRSLPLVQVNVVVKGGWAADPANRPGAASLTAELLDEGTKSRSALELSQEFEALGANFHTGSFSDASDASLNVMKRNLDEGLALLADVVLRPTFPEEELERVRAIYLGRIQQEAKEPITSAIKAFYSELYGDEHPYGQPYTGSGTTESINAIQRADLVAYYEANYVPNNAAVLVTGDITLDEARTRLEKAFREWKPKGDAIARDVPTPAPLAQTKICIIDKPGAAQSMIVAGHLGIRRSDDDYASCLVMNNVLGGQFMSRINMNLREDKGYSYGAGAGFSIRRGVGPYLIYAPVQSQSTKESIVEIVKELRDVKGSRPLTEVEVSDGKNNLIRSYPQEFQSLNGIASKLREMVMLNLPEDEWVRYVRSVSAIDGKTATAAAKSHLNPDALLIIVVGDREKIEAGIRGLKLGEVVTLAKTQK